MKEEYVQKINDAVESLEDEMISFSKEFFGIQTQNPPGYNYPECAECAGRLMEKLGMDVEYVNVPKELLDEFAPLGEGLPRVSVIGTYKGETLRPNIHFTGHFDVVPEGDGWSTDPYGCKIEDGKMYARGSSDQKSGVVSELFALYAIQKAGIKLKGTYIASTTPDEESGGRAGIGYLVEKGYINKDNTDFCVITECLDVDKVCLGHRGVLNFEIETLGKRSHASMPSAGINAIDNMHLLLDAFDEKIKNLEVMKNESTLPLPPGCRKSTLTTMRIIADDGIINVPASCKIGFDWRLNTGMTVEWAKKQILDICEYLKKTHQNFDYKFRIIYTAEPSLVPSDSEVVNTFLAAGKKYLNRDMSFCISPGSDDQKYIVQQGGMDQCIVYGPGILDIAHKVDEYVYIEDMKTSAKIMALASVELLGTVE